MFKLLIYFSFDFDNFVTAVVSTKLNVSQSAQLKEDRHIFAPGNRNLNGVCYVILSVYMNETATFLKISYI